MVQDLNIYYLRGYCPSHNTFLKVQTQGSKDSFCLKKSKLKNLKSVLWYENAMKLPKKGNKKDNKKRLQGQRQEHTKEQKE